MENNIIPQTNITLPEIAELLRESDDILLLSHTRPDGDTIGSGSCLYRALREMGKRVAYLCDEEIPRRLRFLCSEDDALFITTELPCGFTPSLTVAVDIASPSLLGKLEGEYADRVDLRIDHHGTGELMAAHLYVNPEAAAVGEIVYELCMLLGCRDKTALSCAYAAISSDTGGFKYSNVTPKIHRIAAEMLELGVDSADITQKLFGARPLSQVQAYCAAVEMMHFPLPDVAVINFPEGYRLFRGFTEEDIGDLSSIPRQIEGVRLGIVIKQRSDEVGKYKISMRSDGKIDCCALCALFGGGGHAGASGAAIEAETAEDAEKAILAAVLPEFKRMKEELGLQD